MSRYGHEVEHFNALRIAIFEYQRTDAVCGNALLILVLNIQHMSAFCAWDYQLTPE